MGKRIKDSGGKDETAVLTARELKKEIRELEVQFKEKNDSLLHLALLIPNDTHPAVPLGPEDAAITLETRGPPPVPKSSQRDHLSVAKHFNLVDFEAGATTTGSSWYFLLNEAALLEQALTSYALSIAIQHGFRPVTVPDVVKTDIAWRCGYQPRDTKHTESYSVAETDLVLAGTSEIPLGGSFANQILERTKLPTKLVGVGRAFRAEAGARGTDTRGLYRVHQFTKIELFAVTTNSSSDDMMESMRAVQQAILDGLNLHYRVLDMPSEELGASAYRKYDMEAWMPGRGGWGEVSSLSNCTDYQSRRLHIRYEPRDGSAPMLAHTLNGTAAAIPRLIVALLENGVRLGEEEKPAYIVLPKVLKPFWIGLEGSIIRWEGEEVDSQV